MEKIFIPSLHARLVWKEVTKTNIFSHSKEKLTSSSLMVLFERKTMEFFTFVYFPNQKTMKKEKV